MSPLPTANTAEVSEHHKHAPVLYHSKIPSIKLWSAVVVVLAIAQHSSAIESKTLCSPVYITVSSLTDYPGNLELNWDQHCGEKPDWVGLFEVDPTVIQTATPLVKINVRDHPWNFYRTKTILDVPKLPGGWDKDSAETEHSVIPGPHCLPYWIASFKDNILQNTNCLKIQPTWMYDKMNQLSNIPLSMLLLPGTHNSGSYNSNVSVLKGEGFNRFVLTQDHDIWTQLVFGIRYLDFRIGYYRPIEGTASSSDDDYHLDDDVFEDRFWINHDLIKITALAPLLRDIKRFLKFAKNEIVILDIHRLPIGFYYDGKMRTKRHRMLLNLLYQEFEDIAVDYHEVNVPRSKANLHLLDGPRMKDIWESGRRLIICYPEDSAATVNSLIWPRLRQMWGDKQTPSNLKTYIQEVVSQPLPPTFPKGNPLWAVMAHLTPSALDIIFNPRNNLRKMADSINRNLTVWVQNDWWKKANIIATDFYLGNNLIELSINSVPLKTIYGTDGN